MLETLQIPIILSVKEYVFSQVIFLVKVESNNTVTDTLSIKTVINAKNIESSLVFYVTSI